MIMLLGAAISSVQTWLARVDHLRVARRSGIVAAVCLCIATLVGQRACAEVDEEGNFHFDRLCFAPVIASLQKENGKHVALAQAQWRSSVGASGIEKLVPAWPGTDALVARGAVLFLNDQLIAREVLVNPDATIYDAVFDGTHLWLSCLAGKGIYALDKDGRVAAHLDAKTVLPQADAPMPLCAIDNGRVLVAGSPGWVALIERSNGQVAAKVIYEAKTAKKGPATPAGELVDLTMSFRPGWIVAYKETSGRRWAFVDRRLNPLMVDLQTLNVMCYPVRKPLDTEAFPRGDGPVTAFLDDGGLLYVAGSQADFRVFGLDPKTLRFLEPIKRRGAEWHYGNATDGSLAMSDGWIYYAGARRWLRFAPATGKSEVLSARPVDLNGSANHWSLALSGQLGLVCLHHGAIYQISIEP